jgi:hypothetical protein
MEEPAYLEAPAEDGREFTGAQMVEELQWTGITIDITKNALGYPCLAEGHGKAEEDRFISFLLGEDSKRIVEVFKQIVARWKGYLPLIENPWGQFLETEVPPGDLSFESASVSVLKPLDERDSCWDIARQVCSGVWEAIGCLVWSDIDMASCFRSRDVRSDVRDVRDKGLVVHGGWNG